MIIMTPHKRRMIQAMLYEIVAICLISPILAIMFDKAYSTTFLLSIIMSSIAVTWNYIFNWIFEWWEKSQQHKDRSFVRRFMHSLGFEGGLTFLLLPVVALILETTLWNAFFINISLLAFFFIYSFIFTWAFDKVFGLPYLSYDVK